MSGHWLNQVRSADTALTTRPALAPALMLACAAVAIGLLPFASAEHRLTLWIGAAGVGAGLFGLHETLIQMLAPEYPPDPDAAILPAALRHAARSQHSHAGGRHSHPRPPFQPSAGPLTGDTVLDTVHTRVPPARTPLPRPGTFLNQPVPACRQPVMPLRGPAARIRKPPGQIRKAVLQVRTPMPQAPEPVLQNPKPIPQPSTAGWDTRGAEPASDAAGPDTSAAEHRSSGADPATTGTNPEISSAGPEIGRADHASGTELPPAPEAASGELASSIPSTTGATEPTSLATAAQGVTGEAPTTEATAEEATRTEAVQAVSSLAESLLPASAQAETPLAESALDRNGKVP